MKDYTLTIEEQKSLDNFDEIEFGEVTYKSVFNNIKQERKLTKDDQISGDIPLVMAGVTNSGVVTCISNPVARFPNNSITIDIFGNTFFVIMILKQEKIQVSIGMMKKSIRKKLCSFLLLQ